MSVRVMCVIACFFAQGWWLLVFILGAIILPYVAVVLANVGGKDGDTIRDPGSRSLARQNPAPADSPHSDN